MELTEEVKKYIDTSVLCWLATVSNDGIPNVSPKEIFTYYQKETVVVANIASPQTVRNIGQNQNVCLSFIDILAQKGYQIKGKANIIGKKDQGFEEMKDKLVGMTGGKFPFTTITKITVEQIRPIIAPRYLLYPDTTEAEQIESAKKSYGF